jgi:pilus assembly protein CpaE
LTRKAMTLVDQLGFPKERFHVLVNRMDKRDDIGTADMEKLFGCGVHARLPNDYFALHRVVTLGQPLVADCELGRAIESVAKRLSGSFGSNAGQSGSIRDLKPALSGA